ncbi:MAG: hypothetical protein AAF729_03345 [Pseudomonadota bacterium]
MTNRLALTLAILLLGSLVLDLWLYGSEHMIFLGKKLFELIDWLAFWR